jgi:hypothetical protein
MGGDGKIVLAITLEDVENVPGVRCLAKAQRDSRGPLHRKHSISIPA